MLNTVLECRDLGAAYYYLLPGYEGADEGEPCGEVGEIVARSTFLNIGGDIEQFFLKHLGPRF
jgi:hypothetical protein